MTEINVEDAICSHVPVFAKLRESGREFPQAAEIYHVKVLSHGLSLAYPGAAADFKTRFEALPLPAFPPSTLPAIRSFPPADTWVNVHTLGVKGDGTTDDTPAIQKAIAEHSDTLLSQRTLSSPRHTDASPRHGSNRPASQHHAVRPPRRRSCLPGPRRSQTPSSRAFERKPTSSVVSASLPVA